jgi:neutral trehalase
MKEGHDKSTRLIFGNDGVLAGIQATVSEYKYTCSMCKKQFSYLSKFLDISNISISNPVQFITLDQSEGRRGNSYSILP